MATKKKSVLTSEQKDLEAPVKGYQLRELTLKFSEMKDEFSKKLDTIINETKGVVTTTQLKQELKDLEEKITEDVDDKVEKIHLEYGPTKKGIWWFSGIIIIALVGQIAYNLWR